MKNLVFYCSIALCNCSLGGYFERGADSPKLLKRLNTDTKGWSAWNDGTRLQSRSSVAKQARYACHLLFESKEYERAR
jgi:hypothetical protein